MRRGVALVGVLVLMVAVLMLAVSLSHLAQANLTTAQSLVQKAQARALAEAGLTHALLLLERGPPLEALSLEGPGYTCQVEPEGEGRYRVACTGRQGLARQTRLALVQASGPGPVRILWRR